MSASQIFSEKQSVWFEPLPGAVKVPGYVIGSKYVKINGKNEIRYWIVVIHVLANGESVYETLSDVLPSMLSKAPKHPYPSHIRSMRDVKVSMNLPAHAVPLPANAGGRKRVRHEEPDDTDAEDPSSPVLGHEVPEWGPDDAMPGAEEQQDPVENEMEEHGVDKEEGEVDDDNIRQSQINVTLDTFTQAVAQYADHKDEVEAKTRKDVSTPAPSANQVFAWGMPAATATPAPSTGAGASVGGGDVQRKSGEEEATLPITELSQEASQATLNITTHLPRF